LKKIRLYERAGTDTLRHRDTAARILEEIAHLPKSTPIVLDFSGIVFASRSFCHEFMKGLKGRKDVSYINVDPDVKLMMSVAFSKPRVTLRPPGKIKKLVELVPA